MVYWQQTIVPPYEIRKLSIAEINAIASSPEEFQFVGSYRARWARIGNSVPPLFMRAIALHIRQEILPQAMMAGRVA